MAEERPYTRVEAGTEDERRALAAGAAGRREGGIGWGAVVVAVAASAVQAVVTLYGSHRHEIYLTSTQISVVTFMLFVLLVLGVNPALRLVGVIRPFRRAELMAIFASLAVTAGISTFGLADQLVPLIASPYNPKWNTEQRGWRENVNPFLDDRLYIRDEAVVVQFREGLDADESLVRDVPWRAWLGPLLRWLGLIVAGYALFYSLTLVFYPQWAHREKLIFPLAKVPEDLLPANGRGGLPPIVRLTPFWLGFGVPFFVHLWNGSIAAGWLQGVKPIQLSLSADVLRETAFEPLLGAFSLTLFFAVAGIAFLLPPSVSFSVWFYFLVYNAMIFVACSLGFGKTGADFPVDWIMTSNFVSAQGGGAIVVFGAVCLVKALLGTRDQLGQCEPGRRLRVAGPVIGLGVSLVALAWWMVAHVPEGNQLRSILWVVPFVLILTVITASLMRVVAECGFFGFQSRTGPFHFARMLNLPQAIGAAVMVPLMTFYSILFLDIKTFIAPAIINSKKMEESCGAPRLRFHLTVVLSIVGSVAVSIVASIGMAYRLGAQQLSPWFYSRATPRLLDQAHKMADYAGEVQSWNVLFVALGGCWVGASMLLRRVLFWFPHPIGYIMFVNPLVRSYWFSFLLAWLVKRVVLQYGGKHTFDRVKPFFIGLIIGEIMACAFWVLVTWAFSVTGVRIDLNR